MVRNVNSKKYISKKSKKRKYLKSRKRITSKSIRKKKMRGGKWYDFIKKKTPPPKILFKKGDRIVATIDRHPDLYYGQYSIYCYGLIDYTINKANREELYPEKYRCYVKPSKDITNEDITRNTTNEEILYLHDDELRSSRGTFFKGTDLMSVEDHLNLITIKPNVKNININSMGKKYGWDGWEDSLYELEREEKRQKRKKQLYDVECEMWGREDECGDDEYDYNEEE